MSEFTLAFEHENMIAGPVPASTARKIYSVEGASDKMALHSYGTTVPTDATTGYAPGCIFHKTNGTTGTVLYINEGTETSCDFNPISTAAAFGTAAGRGPSPLIWADCPVTELMTNFEDGYFYQNDFMGEVDSTSGDGWTISQTTSGVITTVDTSAGGVMLVDSAGNATADDGLQAQLKNCAVLAAAGTKVWFEARVAMKDTGDDQYFIGLGAPGTDLIPAGGVLEDVVDKVGFFRDSDATNPADDFLSSVIARGSAENITEDTIAVVDTVFIKLGFVIDGLTSVKFYADGVLLSTNTTTASIPNAVIALTFLAKIEQTSADAELSVDWVRVAQTTA